MPYGSLFKRWLGLDSLNVMEVARILMGGGRGYIFSLIRQAKLAGERTAIGKWRTDPIQYIPKDRTDFVPRAEEFPSSGSLH